MSLKHKVLQLLELNRDVSISGEYIASCLGVSRSAVWKAVNILRAEGYYINSLTNKGYCLTYENDILSKEGIAPYLKDEYKNNSILVYKTIGSTNDEAKLKALDKYTHGSVIIADTQTKGKGRMGRSFYSPASTGIYMSFILRPKTDASNAVLLTTASAVAVVRAIKKVCKINPKIKWLNDIYYNDKKICGILSEAVTNCETGIIETVIVGIGINFKTDFSTLPDDLSNTAGSIYSSAKPDVTRNRLTAQVINEILDISESFLCKDFFDEYKENSFVIGKDIIFIKDNIRKSAKAVGISSNGGLIIKNDKGETEILFSGEITLRTKD